MLPAGWARVPSTFCAMARKSGGPVVKMPGENGPTVTCEGAEATPFMLTTTLTFWVAPLGTRFQGTCALTCPLVTKRMGALMVVPPLTN